MLRVELKRFAADESGGGTVMGLFWFMTLVMIFGLAVDVTDGFRARTMLQATADSAALAAAVDLPNGGDAVTTAVNYAQGNMQQSTNGTVLRGSDVLVGAWDGDTKSLDTTAAEPDAVMVTVHRSAANENPMPVNFLRIVGLMEWNVTAQAVAQRFIPDCLRNGLIARNMVDMSSNNSFVNEVCIHGQQGVNIQSNNYFEMGVNVSMYDLDDLELPSSGFDSNPGLQPALREQSLDPRMVNHIDEIIQGVLNRDPSVTPSYINLGNEVVVTDNRFNFHNAQPHKIYHVQCRPSQNLVLPAGIVMQHIALIADCQITIGANASVFNSFIASRSGPTTGNGSLNRGDANISTAAGAQIGVPDNCATGGGVQLFSNATMTFSSTTAFDGVQMVAAGDIALGARDQGINGISAQSGGTINLTSNNMFGLCSSGAPSLLTSWYYRLVL